MDIRSGLTTLDESSLCLIGHQLLGDHDESGGTHGSIDHLAEGRASEGESDECLVHRDDCCVMKVSSTTERISR